MQIPQEYAETRSNFRKGNRKEEAARFLTEGNREERMGETLPK